MHTDPQSPDFESIKQISPYQVEYWSARDLMPLLGYKKWQNFDRLVQRALNLISSGMALGYIERSKMSVATGKGAVRDLLDYHLDTQALQLIKELASSFKLTKHYAIRNETGLLGLLKIYCALKGISFEFQYTCGGYFFDCLISDFIAIEFDEPYHLDNRRHLRDVEKDAFASSIGLRVLRFDLADDIVDMIVTIERLHSEVELPRNEDHVTRWYAAR